jgi:hypothetical protein
MKHYYTFIIALLITCTAFSQAYQFGIVHNGGYSFSVVANPDFDVTNSDVSDIGFALMLPAGNADIINISDFNGRAWSVTQVTEIQFTGAGINSNGRDGFAMNLPPGQTILSHTMNTPFVLVSFDISNMPTAGRLEILTNTDPIAIALGGSIDSFYNANIDNTTTQNYFNGQVSGQEDFQFDTLSVEQVQLADESISVYPNPATNVLNISAQIDITKLVMFDVIGKQVISVENTKTINVSKLNAGVYLLKITSSKGTITKKIVIE